MAKPTLADALKEIADLRDRVTALEADDGKKRKKARGGGKDRPERLTSIKDNGVPEGVEGGSTQQPRRAERINVRGRVVMRAIAPR